jgi:hypothetical protein
MRMHIGRNMAALSLAAVVVGGVAGTALAASGSSSTAQATAAPVVAAKTAAQQSGLAKMTMAQLTAKLGVSEGQMVKALDDVKGTVLSSGKLSHDAAENLMAKVLASDLGISSTPATWAVEEIDGGYVPTYIDWGFGTK